MYSLSDSDKKFVKTYLVKNGLDSYIAKGDGEGFGSAIGEPILDDQLNTFKTLFLTSCHLAGVDCHIKALADNGATNSKGTILCIPDCVERIGVRAFIGNSELKRVYISPSVKYMSTDTFAYCGSLEEITISREWQGFIEKCKLHHDEWLGIDGRHLSRIKFNYI